jgi:PST family polysaccharide transporter
MRASSTIQVGASVIAFVFFAVPALLVAPSGASEGLVLGALALFVFVEGLSIVGAGILRATERFRAYLLLSLLRLAIAVGIGAAGALTAGPTGALYGVALAGAGFAFVGAAPLWRYHRSVVRRPDITRLLRYGLPLIGTTVMVWALSLSDRLFLRAWVTPAELGQYSASYRLGSVVMLFIAGPLALAWIPVARRAGSRTELEQLCLRWGVNVTWAALGAGVLVVAAAPSLVPAIFGQGFVSDNVVVAAVVASGWLFALYYLLATNILIGESTGALAAVSAIVVVFNFGANAAFIADFGARGAAVATLLSYLALAVIAGAVSARSRFPRWAVSPLHLVVTAVFLALVVAALFYPLPAALGAVAVSIPLGVRWHRQRRA